MAYSKFIHRALLSVALLLCTTQIPTVNGQGFTRLRPSLGQSSFEWRCWGPMAATCSGDSGDVTLLGSRFASIKTLSATSAWAVGNFGNIWKWDGNALTQTPSHTNKELIAVDGVNENSAWAVGVAGTILHWDGLDWSQQTSPITDELHSVGMVSDADGWIGSCNGFLRWDGNNWKQADNPLPQICIVDINMLTANNGWAISNRTVFHWDGLTWSVAQDLDTIYVFSMSFTAPNDGWAVGDGIWHYDGSSWFRVSSPSPMLRSIAMKSSTEGWAVDFNWQTLKWDGQHWQSLLAHSYQYSRQSSDISLAPDGTLLGVGFDGTILQWAGTNWDTKSMAPEGAFYAIDIASPNLGWAVGELGYMWRWDGTAWRPRQYQRMDSPIVSLYDVDVVSDSSAWAVGTIVLHWDGTNWFTPTNPINSVFTSISLASPKLGFMASADSRLLRWDGAKWTLENNPSGKVLNRVRLLSDSEGWAVGNEGAIMHWNGSSWLTQLSPTTQPIVDLALVTATDVWALTKDATVMHFDGQNWTIFNQLPDRDVYIYTGIATHPLGGIWAVGHHTNNVPSRVLHWNGQSWLDEKVYGLGPMTNLKMVSATDGWLVGGGHSIMRYWTNPQMLPLRISVPIAWR